MGDHGFPGKQIHDCLEKFTEETKEERQKFETFDAFNEAILKAKKGAPLAKICKGLFVGNILLKNAQQEKHPYLMAWSEQFVILIPFGPIQSVIHLLAIPKVPMYNVVSLGLDRTLLMQKMQAALEKVVTDILTPNSIPQKLYLKHLSQAINQKSSDLSSIKIAQTTKNLDTLDMSGANAVEVLRDMLKDFYNEKKKSGIPLKQAVSTDLHIHDTNSVGQLHMHGWVAEPALITDNGLKLKYKNTPLDRIIPVLEKFHGVVERKKKKIRVVVQNKELS